MGGGLRTAALMLVPAVDDLQREVASPVRVRLRDR
jgi:hypothetical protein